MPLVSVVIPNFNCGSYISKAIESIIEQSVPDWELIICDDGSTDDSIAIVQKWVALDSRIKLLVNRINEGHVYTYNRLFREALGEYIMILDADDWSERTRIQRQVETLIKLNVQLCLSNAVFHNHGITDPQPPNASGYITIHTRETWAPATLMFQKSILLTIPGYSEYFSRGTGMDRYFIMEILDQFKGYYLDEYLYHVLVRPNSDHRSVDLTDPRKMILNDIYLLLKSQRIETGTDWLKQHDMMNLRKRETELLKNKAYISEKIRIFACIQIDHNRKREAWRLLMRAFKLAPFHLDNYRSLLYLIKK